jgi:hypothetical protein
MNRTLRATLAALALAPALAACQLLPWDANVTFASDPPGARVLVDGKDTGFVTPCGLALDRHDNTRLDIQLPGYVTATRILTPDHEIYVILWREMIVSPRTFRFPTWLNVRDFFVPIKYEKTMAPGRVYVRLERSADVAARHDRSP